MSSNASEEEDAGESGPGEQIQQAVTLQGGREVIVHRPIHYHNLI